MSAFARQVLLCLAYCVALSVNAILFDGWAFFGVFLLLTAVFLVESFRVIVHTWHARRSLGGEIDSAGSGSG